MAKLLLSSRPRPARCARASAAPVNGALTSRPRRVLFLLYAAGFSGLRPDAGAGKAASAIQQKAR
ncbi:hypothetical protein, partial [uncultured Desulfovibrio sp.]|uniref:hypothetical protein n=1 Tax=uncultured Desulfovibrio sp. TaxID=167968 RepID=UPI002670BF3A